MWTTPLGGLDAPDVKSIRTGSSIDRFSVGACRRHWWSRRDASSSSRTSMSASSRHWSSSVVARLDVSARTSAAFARSARKARSRAGRLTGQGTATRPPLMAPSVAAIASGAAPSATSTRSPGSSPRPRRRCAQRAASPASSANVNRSMTPSAPTMLKARLCVSAARRSTTSRVKLNPSRIVLPASSVNNPPLSDYRWLFGVRREWEWTAPGVLLRVTRAESRS